MSSRLTDRLRGIVGPASSGDVPEGPSRPEARHVDSVADVLGGQWRESRGQRYLVIDRRYLPGHRHGSVAIADALPPSSGGWRRLALLCGTLDRPRPLSRLLFIDLEATGLTGGAGTYAFLVGCGWFDAGAFRIRQFLLAAYAGERALLEGVSEMADGAHGVVSYNGKAFDLPLIETRFLFHRMETPFSGLPHVDMLHPARRLWRADDVASAGMHSSCRLSVLEHALCGVVREGDVPAFEIPSRYFTYVRTGDVRPLEGVLEHNRLDVLSLALLTARAAQLLDEGPSSCRTAREALGVGRLYERAGMIQGARTSYARAAGFDDSPLPADIATRADALRSYAILCRRERRYADAAAAWQRILDLRRCPVHVVREATEALAVHHEHRLRDPGAARLFALNSLRFASSLSRQAAVRHRLARLERKLAAPAFTHGSLFSSA